MGRPLPKDDSGYRTYCPLRSSMQSERYCRVTLSVMIAGGKTNESLGAISQPNRPLSVRQSKKIRVPWLPSVRLARAPARSHYFSDRLSRAL